MDRQPMTVGPRAASLTEAWTIVSGPAAAGIVKSIYDGD